MWSLQSHQSTHGTPATATTVPQLPLSSPPPPYVSPLRLRPASRPRMAQQVCAHTVSHPRSPGTAGRHARHHTSADAAAKAAAPCFSASSALRASSARRAWHMIRTPTATAMAVSTTATTCPAKPTHLHVPPCPRQEHGRRRPSRPEQPGTPSLRHESQSHPRCASPPLPLVPTPS